jgi:hypothetical protein
MEIDEDLLTYLGFFQSGVTHGVHIASRISTCLRIGAIATKRAYCASIYVLLVYAYAVERSHV